MAVKPLFQLRQRDMPGISLVKMFERKTELGTELVECQFGHACLFENIVGRPPDRRQIVHQSPRPIENDVPNHRRSLVPTPHRAIQTTVLCEISPRTKYRLLPLPAVSILRALFKRKRTNMRRPKGIKTKKSVAKRFKITARVK